MPRGDAGRGTQNMTVTITNKVNNHDADDDVKRHADAIQHAAYIVRRNDGFNDVLCSDCSEVENVPQSNETRLIWDKVAFGFRIQSLVDNESWTIGVPITDYNRAVGTYALLATRD